MENYPVTEEQQKDIDERVAEFRKRYLANVEELQVDFVSFPQYVQTQQGFYGTIPSMQLVDKKYMPIPSPFAEGVQGSSGPGEVLPG